MLTSAHVQTVLHGVVDVTRHTVLSLEVVCVSLSAVLMDKSALCQEHAADPSSGWGPTAPEQAHRGRQLCRVVYYSIPPGGQWHTALGTPGPPRNPRILT